MNIKTRNLLEVLSILNNKFPQNDRLFSTQLTSSFSSHLVAIVSTAVTNKRDFHAVFINYKNEHS